MQEDKALGAWLGMACGDALGQAVKSLKPETIRQLFKRLDEYPDVRPFLGRGVRTYRMRGLYGCPTQMALALAEVLTQKKGPDPAAFADVLVRLSVGGPETYFGAFRRPEGAFVRAVSDLSNRAPETPAPWSTAFGGLFPLGVTAALYYGRDTATFRAACRDTARVLSAHPWETAGAAVAGYLTLRFMEIEPTADPGPLPQGEALIRQAAAFAEEVEKTLGPSRELSPPRDALSRTLTALAGQWAAAGPEGLETWICENANRFLKQPVTHAAQGQTLTLLPLALTLVLGFTDGFEAALVRAAEHGREADKLGALTGAWAGAWYGAGALPDGFKTGLVNNREIRARGEALLRRRGYKGKELAAMELGLTRKEAEEKQKHLPRTTKKKPREKTPASLEEMFTEMGVEWETDPLAELREDPRKWRQFEREKSKKKKERRRRPRPGTGD